jgi:hypothetical protein
MADGRDTQSNGLPMFDPAAPEHMADPYPTLKRIQEVEPLHRTFSALTDSSEECQIRKSSAL